MTSGREARRDNMNSPDRAVQRHPEFPFHRLRDASSRLSRRDSSFLSAASQNQSAQTGDLFSQDVFNQLFDMLDQSSLHSVQPIELNFRDGAAGGSAANTIQISMDCFMRQPDDPLAVSTAPRRGGGKLLASSRASYGRQVKTVNGHVGVFSGKLNKRQTGEFA
ncbi:tumor protein 63-like [Gasterosteus aculeatus]